MITKKIVLKIIQLISTIKTFIFLDNLNDQETEGNILKFTRIKFIPKTKIIVPFALGRSIRGLSFVDNLFKDPVGVFIKNLCEGEEKKALIENYFSILNEEKFCSAADIVGLRKNHTLNKYPAWALVMPWEKKNIEEKFRTYKNTFILNRSKYSKNLYKSKSSDIFYTNEYIESQIDQTTKLLESIKKNKFKRPQYIDSPKIYIMVDQKQWRWSMTDEGNHRAYLSSILKNKFFECVVSAIVNKNNISEWHNVKNNLYSVDEAKIIFEHFFLGNKCLRGSV